MGCFASKDTRSKSETGNSSLSIAAAENATSPLPPLDSKIKENNPKDLPAVELDSQLDVTQPAEDQGLLRPTSSGTHVCEQDEMSRQLAKDVLSQEEATEMAKVMKGMLRGAIARKTKPNFPSMSSAHSHGSLASLSRSPGSFPSLSHGTPTTATLNSENLRLHSGRTPSPGLSQYQSQHSLTAFEITDADLVIPNAPCADAAATRGAAHHRVKLSGKRRHSKRMTSSMMSSADDSTEDFSLGSELT